MGLPVRPALIVLLGCISTATLRPQASARVAPQSFEVASVKPNLQGGDSRGVSSSPGGKFTASNASLRLLICRAYGVPEDQIQGGASRIDTDTWDIVAKANTPLELTREELRPSLQALLADRFQLKIHRQGKPGNVLSLVVAKGGPKLKEHQGEGSTGISASTGRGEVSITGRKANMARLAEYLAAQAGRQVDDNTGLQGEYDFMVKWTTDDKVPGPSVFSALEEQLGLKLEAAKGTIQMIVIDRAEKATAN
jgi:uncharacterized protein (TIGR03435 family)